VHLLVGDGHRVLALERHVARHHLVHDDAEAVEVAAGIGVAALGLLGREIGRRAHHGAGLSEVLLRGGVHGASDAEVSDLHRAGRRHEDVGRLHVAVHDAVAVGEPEGGRHIGRDVDGALRVERAVGAQDVGEGAAVHVLHHHVVRAALTTEVVDAHDVRMREVGGGGGLAAEALDEVRVGGVLGEQDLDGHGPVEQAIAREEDVGHAASTEAAVDLVAIVEDGAVGCGHRGSTGQPTDGSICGRGSGRSSTSPGLTSLFGSSLRRPRPSVDDHEHAEDDGTEGEPAERLPAGHSVVGELDAV
jgi:hypothetical protein